MILSDTSIKRPVLATMMSLALVLFGVISYNRLSVREFPDIDPPIVSVSTILPGANPRVVESAVTDILEEELATLEGLRTLTSISGEQSSNITLEFTLERDIETSAQDVREKVARVRNRLPRYSSRWWPSRTLTRNRFIGWRSRARATVFFNYQTSATGW